MDELTVACHQDTEAWWADVPGLRGFSATAPDLAMLKSEVADGLDFALDGRVPRLAFVSERGASLGTTPAAAALGQVA